ncbi:unnamed protein product [Lactuca virosa]|uniref:Uncharacterized protein n=1 Tax=Lactuca virosa TaxID=75947 RepID=A0AAU9NC67_9ASTR|nr:unnamed protein product [Lactuca virosa]
MAHTKKSSFVVMVLVLSFICMICVPILALGPACFGRCDAINMDCLQLCQELAFATSSCEAGPSSQCCCHD